MTTTAETKIKLSQLIQLVLILSDTKKGEAAPLMGVSQPTFSNWIWQNKGTKIGRIKEKRSTKHIPASLIFASILKHLVKNLAL